MAGFAERFKTLDERIFDRLGDDVITHNGESVKAEFSYDVEDEELGDVLSINMPMLEIQEADRSKFQYNTVITVEGKSFQVFKIQPKDEATWVVRLKNVQQ